jgi:hypothetical protein
MAWNRWGGIEDCGEDLRYQGIGLLWTCKARRGRASPGLGARRALRRGMAKAWRGWAGTRGVEAAFFRETRYH